MKRLRSRIFPEKVGVFFRLSRRMGNTRLTNIFEPPKQPFGWVAAEIGWRARGSGSKAPALATQASVADFLNWRVFDLMHSESMCA